MNILFHTIAIEPERWTPKRVSRPLEELLEPIAEAGFHDLEIYEPHLRTEVVSTSIKSKLDACGLRPVILSSYLNLNPEVTSEGEVAAGIDLMKERVGFYGFRKIRMFAGSKLQPNDKKNITAFVDRVTRMADCMPDTEILLETHDGSLADDPKAVVQAVRDIARPNVALLFQPTFFTDYHAILEQFRLQLPYIRHLHLQNRNPDLSFARMSEGIVPWSEIFAMGGSKFDATLEFVPSAICPGEVFDLAASLEEAVHEAQDARSLASGVGLCDAPKK